MSDQDHFKAWLAEKNLAWWRNYYTDAVYHAQRILERELTCEDRRILKENIRKSVHSGALPGSNTMGWVTAIVDLRAKGEIEDANLPASLRD